MSYRISVLLLLASLPLMAQVPADESISNKEIIKQFLEQVRSGMHPGRARLFMADTVFAHQMNSEKESLVRRTPQNYTDHVVEFQRMYGDYTFEVTELLADGDKVYARWKQVGTHLIDISGYTATGKPLVEIASCVYRLKNGKIEEYWIQIDRSGFEKQLQQNR